MKFQIIQDYGRGSQCFLYFTSESTDEAELKKEAIKQAQADWKKTSSFKPGIFAPSPARPIILVREYNTVSHRKKRNGISFEARWR